MTGKLSSVNSLTNRILIFFIFLLILISSLLLTTTLRTIYQHSIDQLRGHFKTSQKVLMNSLENDALTLARSVKLLSKDFSTKALIASGREDPASLRAALRNHRDRAKATFVMVYTNDGKPVVSTEEYQLEWVELESWKDNGIRFASAENRLFLVKSSPVFFVEGKADPDAWLVMGTDMKLLITDKLTELTGFDVIVSVGEQPIITTGPEEFLSSVSRDTIIARSDNESVFDFTFEKEGWLGYRFPVGWDDKTITSTFVIANHRALLNYQNLVAKLLFAIALLVGISFVFSVFISHGITRRLWFLVDVANKIKRGDYENNIPLSGTIEVRSLAEALESMQDGIRKREEEINKLAFYDELTGLPNRPRFIAIVRQRILERSGQSFTVMLLDIDRFKEVNDTLGHELGDKLIQLIAKRLQSLGSGKFTHAHIGGDEFAILVPQEDEFDTEIVIDQLIALFQTPFNLDGIHLDVSASFGVASYPKDAQDTIGIMQCADIALYTCKGTHKPFAYYESHRNVHSRMRLSLLSELRKAILENQFELYYQPKLDIATGQVVSVESLVRWNHPEHGLIPPDEFIQLAEQSGAISDLTHWIIKVALKQHKNWVEKGIELSISVNVSPIDLTELKLHVYIESLLSEFRISPDMLVLEVTENAVMSEPEQALKALDLLQRMGVKLSIDDFGTGYSSMGQLKDMPVSELKIDKSFVLELANNEDDETIVKSTVDLAHNLGLTVVAEGVENQESLDVLAKYEVELAQGYYISKPLPAERFEQWLLASKYWGQADSHRSISSQ